MGDVHSQTTIMLVGDSHAGHWKAALSAAASQNGVRLLVRWMSACPASGLNIIASNGNRIKGCPEFQSETLAIVQDEHPDAVILAQSDGYGGSILSMDGHQLAEQDQLTLWRTALTNRISELRAAGTHVGFIEDNPGTTFDSILCETRLWGADRDCTMPRKDALSEPLRQVDTQVVAQTGVSGIYSPVDEICGATTCRVVTPDGVPIYRDRTHLSEQWTKTQVPRLTAFITSILGEHRAG